LPLLDKHDIFRYTIQNAFDGDPATSYVEDTEDDLFEINFNFFGFQHISQIALINGYAANQNLYDANNSILELECRYGGSPSINGKVIYKDTNTNKAPFPWNEKFDRTLQYQFRRFEYASVFFNIVVSKIYKGTKYNDTCIAEINIETPEHGWLFGDEP
jgi:hypothetical protein